MEFPNRTPRTWHSQCSGHWRELSREEKTIRVGPVDLGGSVGIAEETERDGDR